MRGATVKPIAVVLLMFLFQSTLPMRGATVSLMILSMYIFISIHTPHAGSDQTGSRYRSQWICNFNPHSPCGERPLSVFVASSFLLFQSTLPMRGATSIFPMLIWLSTHFNPHSPCGERPFRSLLHFIIFEFQSTLPMRGATSNSIYSPYLCGHFNPHSPCGERRIFCKVCFCCCQFQSTLPMRGATD